MDTTNLNQSGIYAITSPSGKMYIGSAVNIRQRWYLHRSDLAKGKHHCTALQHAYNKYGGELVYSVLMLCPKEDLIKEEQRHIDLWRPKGMLYNSSLTAGSCLGMKHSDETKARISAALGGKRGTSPSGETRARIAAALRGRQLSEETRAKMAASQRGKGNSEETRAKISAAKRGRQFSEETRAKIAAALLGRATKNNTSGFVGITKNGANWKAEVKIHCKKVYLGTYPTAELANQARQNFDRILRHYYDY
uniref:Homing endonuclease n=1 Tax=Xanthomonas phage MK21 TaxID=3148942 RepID=A0AAU7J7X6_9CAUD